MKVMCIKEGQWYSEIINCFFDGPKYGDIVGAKTSPTNNSFYIISGYEFDRQGRPVHYLKSFFIPLSDIDETEVSKQREKELINH